TWNGVDKGVLLLERNQGPIYTHQSSYTTAAYVPLATLLSSSYPYGTHSTTYWVVIDPTHNYALVQLSPFAFQVLDQAGYPATGASVQAFLNLTTHEVLDFGAKFVNGTFGSEFTGLMPGAGANLKVGWVEFVLPAPRTTSGTTFSNITLLVRYKAKDPTNGPVVGRFEVSGFTYPFSSNIPYQPGTTIDATSGSQSVTLTPVTWNVIKTTIKWVYIKFTDINGNDWLTHKAEIYFKWYENPNGAYPYGGSTYDYGKAIVRIPSTLTGSPWNAQFNFTLTYGVEWFFSLVGSGNRVKPSTITSPFPAQAKMVKLSGIRMVSSAEIPQTLRSDLSVNLFLPAVQAYPNGVPVNLSWATNGTGYVVSPDPGPSGNTSIWLPSSDIGQINFQAWFQGVKVLDTGISGVIPAGATPLSLTTTDYGTQKNYSLAIYELGFVLNFYDGQTKTPVPSGIPFFFNHPGLGLIGPTTVTGQGVYDLIKAAPGGTYSNFFILYNGSYVQALNASISLTGNSPNLLLLFPSYNLNMSVWSQEPFNIVGVKVRLYSETNFSKVGLPAYKLKEVFDSPMFSSAMFPTGWTYTVTYNPDGTPYVKYWSPEQTTTTTGVYFKLLPAKVYDVWVHVPALASAAKAAGFRPGDANATLYWSKDPYPGVKPINLTQNLLLQLMSYVYDPKFSIKDAGGNSLPFDNASSSAFFVVEPWFSYVNATTGDTESATETFLTTTLTNYLVRANETDSSGAITVPSVNATGSDYPGKCRFMIGQSTWQPANGYRVMVYYKGILVYNATVNLSNPYVGKENPIITSVYPYVLKITNNPLDAKDKFGIANLKVKVAWAGLNTTWWPTKDLVTWKAATEFSLINATLLQKGFNLTVIERMWGPIQNASFVVPTMPPYYSDAYFVTEGITGSDGTFRLLIPVWNATTKAPLYTKGTALNFTTPAAWYPGNLSSGTYPPTTTGALFGTPVFANWTTIPGTTNNIPAGDVVRLAATFYNQKDTTLGTAVFSDEVRALNATGLYNATSYYSSEMETYKSYGKAPGVLSGGLFQGRKVGPPTVYADFYAYVEVYAPANDLGVVVYDYFQNINTAYSHDLPNQYVAIVRKAIKDSSGNVLSPRTTLLQSWTPIKRITLPNGTQLRAVLLKSSPSNILWGFYDVDIFTTNVTQSEVSYLTIPSENELGAFKNYSTASGLMLGGVGGSLADKQVRPQWLAKSLKGSGADWDTGIYGLQWPTKLNIKVYAADGVRTLNGAYVYIIDARTNYNVSVALTGSTGEASEIDNVPYDPSLDPTVDPFTVPGTNPVTLRLGFNLLNGTYIVKVVYKGVNVWDTFRDQPQHRYIYLGVTPPPTATGEDFDPAQTRPFSAHVYDLGIKVADQSPAARPLSGATVKLTAPYGTETATTTETGETTFTLLPAGTYVVEVSAPSKFGTVTAKQEVKLADTTTVLVPVPLYDITLKVVSPRGTPLVAADVKVGGISVGTTDATGSIAISQIPAGSYPVSITWLGTDVSPTAPLSVALSQAYLVTASKIATVTVQVLGAQNQGLSGATVTIGPITGITTGDGTFTTEIPFGTYTATASYKGVSASQSVTVSGDTTVTLRTGTFIELFGQSLTFASFVLWIIAVIIIVLILVIAAQEYNIYRRKKLPQLFGAGPK
ncbi:MAG: carboxypeptidase regulatory-like domain-containing protein, partial [Thaumarchaeota archaeon]|nr:carboxypeptidase regulatory-like domain-containing protein [Nitrososphaerota archaeon]